jgi:hypothetical protein
MGAVQSAFGALGLTGGTITGNLTVSGTTTLNNQTQINTGTTPALQITGTTNGMDLYTAQGSDVTTHCFKGQVTGDGNARYTVGVDGQVQWGPGSAGRDVTLNRSAVGVLSVSQGAFSVTTAGQGLAVKEGANAKQGTAVLVAGAVVVANTAVTANSRILLTSQVDGGAPGFLRVSARTAGTSFTITSSSGTDTSTVAFQIFEPA